MPVTAFGASPETLQAVWTGEATPSVTSISNRLPPERGSPIQPESGIIFRDLVEAGAYIRNFGIIDPRIRFGNRTGLLGRQLNGSLENSYIVAQSGVAGFRTTSLGGGGTPEAQNGITLFFFSVNGGRIRNSFTDFRIWVPMGGAPDFVFQMPVIGGLVGNVGQNAGLGIRSNIENCYVRGDMHSSNFEAGGIAKELSSSDVRNVYTTSVIGTVTGATAFIGGLVGEVMPSANVEGTNFFVDPAAGSADGIDNGNCASGATCVRGTTGTAASDAAALAEIRALSVLPADWSADDWDLRGPTQTPALKYGGGPDVCGDLCGQLIPNQPD